MINLRRKVRKDLLDAVSIVGEKDRGLIFKGLLDVRSVKIETGIDLDAINQCFDVEITDHNALTRVEHEKRRKALSDNVERNEKVKNECENTVIKAAESLNNSNQLLENFKKQVLEGKNTGRDERRYLPPLIRWGYSEGLDFESIVKTIQENTKRYNKNPDRADLLVRSVLRYHGHI